MKDYTEPTVETYGSVEKLSETSNDGGYGGMGDDDNNDGDY